MGIEGYSWLYTVGLCPCRRSWEMVTLLMGTQSHSTNNSSNNISNHHNEITGDEYYYHCQCDETGSSSITTTTHTNLQTATIMFRLSIRMGTEDSIYMNDTMMIDGQGKKTTHNKE